MSVIIKGMKLPQHAAVNGEKNTAYKCVILAHPDNSVELVIDTKFASAYDNGHNIQRYLLTEIPTPHDSSRFVELPIKPGEKIFYYDTAGRIYESTVTQLVYGATGFLIDSDVMFNSNLIGERFFLTRESAEQSLKEREAT